MGLGKTIGDIIKKAKDKKKTDFGDIGLKAGLGTGGLLYSEGLGEEKSDSQGKSTRSSESGNQKGRQASEPIFKKEEETAVEEKKAIFSDKKPETEPESKPEEPKKRAEIPTLGTSYASIAKRPETVEEEKDPAMAEVEAQLLKLSQLVPPGEKGAGYYEDLRESAKKAFKDDKSRTEWLRVAETLGNALIQLGAARTGGKKADMSGLKLTTADWDKALDRTQDEYKTELSEVDKAQKSEESAKDKFQRQLDKAEMLKLRYADLKQRVKERKEQRQDQDLARQDRVNLFNAQERNQREMAQWKAELAAAQESGSSLDAQMAAQKLKNLQLKNDKIKAEIEQVGKEKPKENDVEGRALRREASKLLGSALAADSEAEFKKAIPILIRLGATDEELDEMTDGFGINEKALQNFMKKLDKKPTETTSDKDPKIENYATKFGLDYSKAEEILRSRGYGK